MDNTITCLFLFIVLALVIWAFVKRYSGDYDEGGNGYDGGSAGGDDISGTSWNSPWSTSSRRRMGSFSESSSRISTSSSRSSSNRSSSSRSSSSRPSSGSRSSSVTKTRPTKSYDSPKVRTRGGFGRGK